MSLRELTILGSSAQQHTRLRNHNGYFIRWKQEGLLFEVGEGIQRQFIFANIAPTGIHRIFISHFHGDHCLGLGAIILRLNLDKVTHPVHIYYPKKGKKYFDRLRYSTIYKEAIEIVEHPIDEEGGYEETEKFFIHAAPLSHGVDCLGWRIVEKDELHLKKDKLAALPLRGIQIRELIDKGSITTEKGSFFLKDVSYIKKGEAIAVIMDTRPCKEAVELARDASLLVIESTYLESEKQLAEQYLHLTAKEAALIAHQAGAKQMILSHFSARYSEKRFFEEEARTIFPNAHSAEDLKRFSF